MKFCVFGAGRMGSIHAGNVAAREGAELAYVVDPNQGLARQLADRLNATPLETSAGALEDRSVDAVIIASATETHAELIVESAKAGKAILCEKPIDLNMSRVRNCEDVLDKCPAPLMIGFQRRFDASLRAVKRFVGGGEIGQIETIAIVSRDPVPPPGSYIAVSGGQFHDQMIHDFDMALWMSGEAGKIDVFAMGSNLVDPEIGRLGDTDTAHVLMRFESGAFCKIDCSRRTTYGYDQRVEVFGSKGMVSSTNHHMTGVETWTCEGTATRSLLKQDFLARYLPAYAAELDEFIAAVELGQPVQPDFRCGRRALQLADAARLSHETGKRVEVDAN